MTVTRTMMMDMMMCMPMFMCMRQRAQLDGSSHIRLD